MPVLGDDLVLPYVLAALAVYIVIAVLLCWIPIKIAQAKGYTDGQYTGICVLSIVGIFTFGILWFAALVWACAMPSRNLNLPYAGRRDLRGQAIPPHTRVASQSLTFPDDLKRT